MKVTPLKKQSKKNQRKFHAAKRGSWNGVSPITRVVQSKRIYDRNRTKQESRQSGDRWQNRADRTKFHKSHNIFFGCTAATSSMKQQAPKTLPQKAETIENTRKTADILIGAACHIKTLKPQWFQGFSLSQKQCLALFLALRRKKHGPVQAPVR